MVTCAHDWRDLIVRGTRFVSESGQPLELCSLCGQVRTRATPYPDAIDVESWAVGS